MRVESLEELSAAFGEWRKRKRHLREPTPEGLVKQARAAARVYGVGRVARAVKLDVRHLRDAPEEVLSSRKVPSYSRMEVPAPVATARPIAEVEMPNGVRLRLYTQAPEVLSLLSSVCTVGGRR